MKPTMILLLTMVLGMNTMAQTGMVTGRLKDSSSGKLLPLATITVFKAKDTSIVTYRLSNPDGEFRIPGLPLNVPLRMIATYSGYEAFRKDFSLSVQEPQLHFDTIKMSQTAKQLDEVIVIAERPPVVVKNDTIEFNATAFKTLPNALVEDLLKKLPGVQVDGDGNITVNGKPVNRLLVDGKSFFGNDPKMATRNLPANMIDKVQVADDKEEMARNGDDNPNNVGKVVNITLKKGIKKGWFGRAYAGGGTDDRYEGGIIANIFRDTLQLSLLGYANNLNRTGFGFSELMQAGGLERSSSNLGGRSTSIWSNGNGSGITINGINFGGLQGSGITTSKGAGFNLNHAPNKKKTFFLQYFYGNAITDRYNNVQGKQFNGDTVISNNTLLNATVVSNAHNIGAGTKLQPDSVTTILANVNYTIGLNNENRISNVTSAHSVTGPQTMGTLDQENNMDSYSYKHSIYYTRLSPVKKGRRLNLYHNLYLNNRFNDFITDSRIRYLNPVVYDSILQQLRREGLPQLDLNAGFNFSNPFNSNLVLRTGGRYEYGRFHNATNTFNPVGPDKEYDQLNSLLSSDFNRESNRFIAYSGLEFKQKSLLITPGVKLLAQSVNNYLATQSVSLAQKDTRLLPAFDVTFKQLSFSYNMDIVLPGYTYLMPVTNNTNPYVINKGNTMLLPGEKHSFSLNYYFNDPKRNLNIGVYANAAFTNNDVVQSIMVDPKGIQTNTPVNADGSSNYYLNYNINKQYKNKQSFTLGWNFGAYYGINKGRLYYNGTAGNQTSFYLNQWSSIRMNFNDVFEWNNSYSVGYNFTENTNPMFKRLNVFSHYVTNETILRYPKHVIWESNINYSYNGSIPAGMPKDVLRWNLGINFTMLKDEKGVLRIGINDVLNRNNSVYVTAQRNQITTTESNVLGRYLLATFTYNIRAVGSPKKKVGGNSLFAF